MADGLQSVNLYECRQNEGIATVSNRVRYNNGTQIVLADVDWFIKIFELVSYAAVIGRDCRIDSGTFEHYRKSFSNFECGRMARHLKSVKLNNNDGAMRPSSSFLPSFWQILRGNKESPRQDLVNLRRNSIVHSNESLVHGVLTFKSRRLNVYIRT